MDNNNIEVFEQIHSDLKMSDEDRISLYTELIKKHGHWKQIEMLYEEMGETLQALNKLKRTGKCEERIYYPSVHSDIDYSNKYFSVCSELADLEIMLEQMKIMFSSLSVDLSKERKLQRQKERLKNDKT